MHSLTVMYTEPESDAEDFLAEYRRDHLPLAEAFPNVGPISVTTFTSTPRGTPPAYYAMFQATWDSEASFQEAMRSAEVMEASRHAMGMIRKYGNAAEMLVGDTES